MPERTNGTVLKTVEAQVSVGSNPTPSAKNVQVSALGSTSWRTPWARDRVGPTVLTCSSTAGPRIGSPQLCSIVCRDRFGASELGYRRGPSPLSGGRFSSVFAFEVVPPPDGWAGRFVLRVVQSAAQARLEAGLHDAASAGARLAPRIALCVEHPSDIGPAYLVIERVSGRSYLRGVEPARFALDLPKLLAAWPRQLPRLLEALARVDPADVVAELRHRHVEDLARPGRHVRSVTTTLANEATLAGVVDWLHEHEPSPPPRWTLVHGDLWPGNAFIDDKHVQLIDWTRGGLDDPALDVGFAKVGLALMPEPFPPAEPIARLVHLAGASIAARISSQCDPLVGGSARTRYYEALRCALELADIVAIRRSGDRSMWEHGVPALVRHLEDITGQPIAFT